MRKYFLIAFFAILAVVLSAGSAAAQSLQWSYMLQIMEENNLTFESSRTIPVGAELTFRGETYIIERGDTPWGLAGEIINAEETTTVSVAYDANIAALEEEIATLRGEYADAQMTIANLEGRVSTYQEAINVMPATQEVVPWWMYVLIAVLMIGIAVMAIMYLLRSGDFKNLQRAYDTLLRAKQQLREDFERLRGTHERTVRTNEELVSQVNTLLQTEKKLVETITALTARANSAEREASYLEVDNKNLEDDVATLRKKLASVRSALEKLYDFQRQHVQVVPLTLEFAPAFVPDAKKSSERRFHAMLYLEDDVLMCRLFNNREFEYSPEKLRKEVLQTNALTALRAQSGIRVDLPTPRQRGWMDSMIMDIPSKEDARKIYNQAVRASNVSPLRKAS